MFDLMQGKFFMDKISCSSWNRILLQIKLERMKARSNVISNKPQQITSSRKRQRQPARASNSSRITSASISMQKQQQQQQHRQLVATHVMRLVAALYPSARYRAKDLWLQITRSCMIP